jgi:hypothetical protein
MKEQRKLGEIRKRIVKNDQFNANDWYEIGDLTDCQHIIEGHDRLLRSLRFGDDDYPQAVAKVLKSMQTYYPNTINDITGYLDIHYPDENEVNISTVSTVNTKKIVFSPNIFDVPELEIDNNLVSIMMPFSGFDDVHQGIRNACIAAGFKCQRADDIWGASSILQDIFSLIYTSKIVIADFSEKNPNVMYEVGIAHALGKLVIPITQSLEHIPSDLRGHRFLTYLKNGEGIEKLTNELTQKLKNHI